MNSPEKQLETLTNFRINFEVKSHMREELSAYADLHTINAPKHAKRGISSVSTAPFRFYRLYASFAAFILIIAGLGGTAFAAESSLPGDALYAVKVKVSEPLQTAIIPSPRGKASWHAILAERRLEEATKLAEQDKLSPEAQTEIAANFDTQVSASQENADRLQRMGDSFGSLDVRSDLEARITAHAKILSTVMAHLAVADSNSVMAKSTKNASSTTATNGILLADVEMQQKTVASTRIAFQLAIAPSSGGDITASSSTTSAIALTTHPREHRFAAFSPAQHIERSDTAREQEVDSILERHAAVLAKFAVIPVASTTATSTATTTEEVGTEGTATSSEENLK